ncbi:hypothetical protein B0J13DRAFT_174775 [Dactylonectria estremocensis]|uniref:Uncharacterized protein n=1 Tax=Dactylonectria estremocensis TaxID=1079267 RepID=A0A9P9FD50_9HYPO|nr:hypothetical protein B0J13DRAFT_174775 [Dactylonectria estremocensis]
MPPKATRLSPLFALLLPLSLLSPCALAYPSSVHDARDEDTHSDPLSDKKYLPAQIGGIIGAYAFSLVLVAIALLALSKKRREHLSAGNEEVEFSGHKDIALPDFQSASLHINTKSPGIQNFSLPSPTKGELGSPNPYVHPSPTSTIVGAPGVTPPPVPTDQVPFGAVYSKPPAPATPDISPQSVQSIDERIGSQLPVSQTHTRNASLAPTEVDPESATSEHSQAHLVGLPSSPKPGARFPTLPSSPKPGQTFQRSNTPSAVRTGGALPLRAYEPAMTSPNVVGQTTKQTVFERRGPLSPSGAMTPYTAGAVPYSPYQPFTPCMPMTPSLVTKQDRKRMKRMVPKTPTLNMVQSSDEVW